MAGKETVRGAVVDQRVASQPSRGPAPGPGVPELIPRRQQVRALRAEFTFEPAEGSLALDSPCQPAPRRVHRLSVGEAGHAARYQAPGGQRVEDGQVQLIEDRQHLAVMQARAVQNTISPVPGLISQWCSQPVRSASASRSPPGRGYSGQAPGQDKSLPLPALKDLERAQAAADRGHSLRDAVLMRRSGIRHLKKAATIASEAAPDRVDGDQEMSAPNLRRQPIPRRLRNGWISPQPALDRKDKGRYPL